MRESPIGMAPASQAGSGGFDSRLALQKNVLLQRIFSYFLGSKIKNAIVQL